jgi:hypothetical protein
MWFFRLLVNGQSGPDQVLHSYSCIGKGQEMMKMELLLVFPLVNCKGEQCKSSSNVTKRTFSLRVLRDSDRRRKKGQK